MSHEEFDCEGRDWYSGLQRQEELLNGSFVDYGGHAGRERGRSLHTQQNSHLGFVRDFAEKDYEVETETSQGMCAG